MNNSKKIVITSCNLQFKFMKHVQRLIRSDNGGQNIHRNHPPDNALHYFFNAAIRAS